MNITITVMILDGLHVCLWLCLVFMANSMVKSIMVESMV